MSAVGEHRTVALGTPEGVDLEIRLADLGERAIAFALDGALIVVAIVALGLTGTWAAAHLPGSGFWLALAWVTIFLVQSFYFVVFELRWQGLTPGKRWQKVRVISRDGGPLTAGMVFARNVTRQVELTIPLVLLLQPRALTPGAPEWAALLGLLWALALLFFPVLNRQRARLGDLAAGTLVVSEPEARLEPDLAGFSAEASAAAPAGAGGGPDADPEIGFTRAQLEIYGNKELQTLEQILRQEPTPETAALLRTVAGKVRHKIGWELPPGMDRPPPPRRFLVAFYAAQRRRLEHELLLGRPREEKRW